MTTFKREAELAVRLQVRKGIDQARNLTGESLTPWMEEALEDLVCESLADRGIAWALAFVAGVTMAPELVRNASRPITDAHGQAWSAGPNPEPRP